MSPLAALMRAKHNALPPMAWELALQPKLGLPSLDMLRFTVAFFLSVLAGAGIRLIPSTKGVASRADHLSTAGPPPQKKPRDASQPLNPNPQPKTARHLYSFLTGLALVYYPFGSSSLHALPPALITYAVVKLVPRKCGTLAWLVNFPYLLCLHAANASGLSWNSGELDFTGGQMVLTLKLIALAMCVQDAQRAADAAAAAEGGSGGSPSKTRRDAPATTDVLTRYQAAHAIPACPPLLDYLGFCFCFGNLLGGPFLEYSDYSTFAARQGVWSPVARPRPAPVGAAFLQGLRALFTALICAGLHSLWSPVWNGQLFLSEWWKQASIPVRLLAFCACGTTVRMKYYFAWGLGEASCAFAGLDFIGWSDGPGAAADGNSSRGQSAGGGDPAQRQTVAAAAVATAAPSNGGAPPTEEQPQTSSPKPIFGRCCNCNVLKVEFGDSSRVMPASWNTQTGVFLRRYVYERVTPPGRKPTFRTLLITQLVAGVWHGLYPGYFLFFASSALYFAHSTTLYTWEKAGLVPRWLLGFPLYRAAKILATKTCLDYAASAFQLLTWRECLATYASVRWLPHFYMAAWLLLGRAFPVGKKKARAAAAAAGAAAGEGEGGGAADGSGKAKAA
jgi:lysophospholipid acyltransferase